MFLVSRRALRGPDRRWKPFVFNRLAFGWIWRYASPSTFGLAGQGNRVQGARHKVPELRSCPLPALRLPASR